MISWLEHNSQMQEDYVLWLESHSKNTNKFHSNIYEDMYNGLNVQVQIAWAGRGRKLYLNHLYNILIPIYCLV